MRARRGGEASRRGAAAFARAPAHKGKAAGARRVRRCAVALLLAALLLTALPSAHAAENEEFDPPLFLSEEPLSDAALPEVEASAYFVMDAGSGQILLQRAPDARHFPASVTKILTAALVLEACGDRLSEQTAASEAALAAVGEGSTMIALRPGEVLTVEQLLYATLLESANDAANVLGEFVDGDLPAFVRRMNETAQALGMAHSHFENPSGYHADGHYSTARDLAKAMQWALTVPGFLQLLQTTEYTLPPTNQTAYVRQLRTDNRLLLEGAQHYDGILGGKSGWTPEARYTMIEAAQRNGHTLISVVLDCPSAAARYADSAYLLDYCFANFRSCKLDKTLLELPEVLVWSGGEQKGTVQLETAASILLPEGCTQEDLRIETDLPRWYVYGVEFEAAATVYDRRTGREICRIAVEPEPETLQRLLGIAPHEEEPWDPRKAPVLVLYAALIALLAYLTSFFARRTGDMRRRAAEESIRRLRSRLPEREPEDIPKETPEDAPEGMPEAPARRPRAGPSGRRR